MAQAIVIGGGFSGAMTAVQLAARGIPAIVVEPGELGRGVAYADGPATLLLNTPAAAMSALPDRPDDFVDWLAHHGDHRVFAPRADYGLYVREKLAGIAQVRARAIDVTPDGAGYLVACSDGTQLRAPHVVFALGNAPPRTPDALRGLAAYRPDPYRAMLELPVGSPIALLGTGLTALDVAATLRHRGHTGPIVAISRRGLVPLRHPGVPATDPVPAPAATTLAGLLAWWRATAASVTAKVDALRPLLPALWQGLSLADRARFVRHVRPRWETVRHRAPPEVHDHVASLEIVAGALASATPIPGGLRLVVGARTLDVAALVNCTGPERDLARQAEPLVQSLLRRALVERDPLGLGAGALAPNLHAVGPWRIADRWESTAVGELRVQAAEVAQAISEHVGEAAPGALEQPGTVVGVT